jgi:NAD(P)-dependent dehydrogenase (short-subunit alcohol dehydrogenase family)
MREIGDSGHRRSSGSAASRARPGRVIAVQADVADADAVARMVARTEAELGPVSILVQDSNDGNR